MKLSLQAEMCWWIGNHPKYLETILIEHGVHYRVETHPSRSDTKVFLLGIGGRVEARCDCLGPCTIVRLSMSMPENDDAYSMHRFCTEDVHPDRPRLFDGAMDFLKGILGPERHHA